ncbi:MAG: DEAD/DEAH box helicase [Bacteroidales bacterium]|nr:DEAD/DEAH box helicase [Bacteroidales bacterium]
MNENDIIGRSLAKAGVESLNEMQVTVLEESKRSNDLILLSPTGSGKTLAFLLPLLLRLDSESKSVQALIIAPSRELALQIEQVFRSLGSGYRVLCCYGGHPVRTEKKSLEQPPAVLIGTPGRLADHIERGNVDISGVTMLVLDEFDKSLELGFTEQMEYIISRLFSVRYRMLTSATDLLDIPEFTGVKKPVRINYLHAKQSFGQLSDYVVYSPEKEKLNTLYKLLCSLGKGSSLVFCNFRESVERVSNFLTSMGIINEVFHGGMEQVDREHALLRFRNGTSPVVVSTDLAARGLDIPDIRNIIHYHLPVNEEAYIHRNGRTARMHAEGASFLILHEEETLPPYVISAPVVFELSDSCEAPEQPDWMTLTISRGKRDKLSKKDIVGFLYQKGGLKPGELGIVEVKDAKSFAAVKRSCFKNMLSRIRNEKIKNMTVKFQ